MKNRQKSPNFNTNVELLSAVSHSQCAIIKNGWMFLLRLLLDLALLPFSLGSVLFSHQNSWNLLCFHFPNGTHFFSFWPSVVLSYYGVALRVVPYQSAKGKWSPCRVEYREKFLKYFAPRTARAFLFQAQASVSHGILLPQSVCVSPCAATTLHGNARARHNASETKPTTAGPVSCS